MNMTYFRKHLPWGLLAFFAIGVGLAALAPYLTFNSANFNNATMRYATGPTVQYGGLFVHAVSAGVALFIGPFQFLSGLRNRRPTLHRWLGRVYLVSVGFGGLSAFVIAPGIISGLVGEFGLIMLAGLWLGTGYMAYTSIRAGNVVAHRQWMIRNYALTFAGVTLRLWIGILMATQMPYLDTQYGGDFDALFVEIYRVVMWLSWVPNLILAEVLVQRRATPQLTAELQTAQASVQARVQTRALAGQVQ